MEGDTHTRTHFHQLGQEAAPLGPEGVSAGEAAITTDDAEVGDAAFHQVTGGFQASLPSPKILAPGAADDCAPLWDPQMGAGSPSPPSTPVSVCPSLPPNPGSGFGLFSGLTPVPWRRVTPYPPTPAIGALSWLGSAAAHQLQHHGDAFPRGLLDVVPTVHQPLIALGGGDTT